MLHDMDFVPHQPWMDRNKYDTFLDFTLEHYYLKQWAWLRIATTIMTNLVGECPELNQDLTRPSTAEALIKTNLQGFTSLLQSIRDKEKTWGDFRRLGD
jgi:hypothetical protein